MSTEGIGRPTISPLPATPTTSSDAAPERSSSSTPQPDAGLPAAFAGRPAQADATQPASLQPRIGLPRRPAIPASQAASQPPLDNVTAAVLAQAAQGTMGLRKSHAKSAFESAAGIAIKGLVALAKMQPRESR